VRVYFERGAPLPARRTFVHNTVETIARSTGASPPILKIPIVQGELGRAHLCRLVGTLEIPGSGIAATLPAGSQIELTLELDRGGHLSARAFVPALSQVFEQVAHLLVPDAAPEVLTQSMAELSARRCGATRRSRPLPAARERRPSRRTRRSAPHPRSQCRARVRGRRDASRSGRLREAS
jgi:molecular chaperone DnaK